VISVFTSLLTRSMLLLVPLVGAIVVAAVLARALLGGVHFNVHQLKPKPKHLNPLPGIKRMFSVRQIGQLGRLTAKLLALGVLALALWNHFTAAVFAGPSALEAFVSTISSAIGTLLISVLALSVVAGGLDGTLAVRRYRKDLRMSKQELRDEAKQIEANPMVKQEIRARQRKLSRMRMMAEVVRADVVLTNPTHLAIALRYEPDSPAPKVVAKGAGHIAARIREVAKDAGVPVRENKPLARALYHSVEIGDLIPVQLYQAVAEVLALVYRAARRHGARASASAAAGRPTAAAGPTSFQPVNRRSTPPTDRARS
jgi:flagellar biosynthetic protein FlhB